MPRAQVEEVARFVADNARRVLGVDAAKVLAVSARDALAAKLAAGAGSNGPAPQIPNMMPSGSQRDHLLAQAR